MHVLFSDEELMRWGGQVHLANLGGHWCVVGPGFLCAVADVVEGNSVMARLRAVGAQRGVVIEYDLSKKGSSLWLTESR